MATYKHLSHLIQDDDDAFDGFFSPNTLIYCSGIYRCVECGNEIAATMRKAFPECGHHFNPPTLWRLIVRANQ